MTRLVQFLMRFLADINIPQSVIKELTKLDNDVFDLKKFSLEDKDVDIIKRAQKEDRVILTLDKDFIVLTQFPKYQVPTIVIRLKKQNPAQVFKYLIQLLKNQRADVIQKSLTIVTEESADSNQF